MRAWYWAIGLNVCTYVNFCHGFDFVTVVEELASFEPGDGGWSEAYAVSICCWMPHQLLTKQIGALSISAHFLVELIPSGSRLLPQLLLTDIH